MQWQKKMRDFYKRLIVSIITIVVVMLLIFYSSAGWIGYITVLAVAALAAIGVWEYAQLAQAKDLKTRVGLMMLVAVAEVLVFFLALKGVIWSQMPLLVLALGFVLFFIRHFRGTVNALVHVAVEFFGVCYIAVPFSFMLGILYLSSSHLPNQDGRWWLIYLILVTKVTDMGAYFVGKLWGKHKLAPVLSPKKTIEGACAGFVCAVLVSIAFHYLGVHFSGGTFTLNLFPALWLGMALSVFGQLGDLAESLLKRDAVVKDSNKLPGLGGVLDMVDSLLFTVPVLYFYLHP